MLKTPTTSIKCIIFLMLLWVGSSGCQKAKDGAGNSMTVAPKTIPVGKGPDAMFLLPDEDYLYVANVEDSILSIVDTENDVVSASISGIKYPWGFVRLGESSEVAVSGYGNILAVIDFSHHQIVRKQNFSNHLGGITASHSGETIYVVATDANKVLQINAASLAVEDEFPTGDGPDGIGISKDGKKLYVTNTNDGTISVIHLDKSPGKLLKTGGKPELIHYNHDHSKLLISNFINNVVHIVDTESDSIVHEITGLDGPEEAVFSPDETKLYVVNFNIAKVFVYDAATLQKLPTSYPTGNKPIGVMPLSNNKIYVTNYGDNTLSVIRP
jgi:YVTN family beta-propeller protein